MSDGKVYRTGEVYIQRQKAGVIGEQEDGYFFQYDEKYLASGGAIAVSLTLPLQAEPYTSTVLFSFFDGLIPEGWLLSMVSRNWKIDQQDRFGLLLLACDDCIGDVQIRGGEIS
jgi:serine/threonine-protein kinase HipA